MAEPSASHPAVEVAPNPARAQRSEILRALYPLKKTEACLLLAMAIDPGPLGAGQLITDTGWSKNRITAGLQRLDELGLATSRSRYEGWSLTPRARSLLQGLLGPALSGPAPQNPPAAVQPAVQPDGPQPENTAFMPDYFVTTMSGFPFCAAAPAVESTVPEFTGVPFFWESLMSLKDSLLEEVKDSILKEVKDSFLKEVKDSFLTTEEKTPDLTSEVKNSSLTSEALEPSLTSEKPGSALNRQPDHKNNPILSSSPTKLTLAPEIAVPDGPVNLPAACEEPAPPPGPSGYEAVRRILESTEELFGERVFGSPSRYVDDPGRLLGLLAETYHNRRQVRFPARIVYANWNKGLEAREPFLSDPCSHLPSTFLQLAGLEFDPEQEPEAEPESEPADFAPEAVDEAEAPGPPPDPSLDLPVIAGKPLTAAQAWDELSALMMEELPLGRPRGWLGCLRLLRYEAEPCTFIFTAPTPFLRDLTEDRFGSLLARRLVGFTARNVTVRIVLDAGFSPEEGQEPDGASSAGW